MDEKEVIARLQEHLKARKYNTGCLSKWDRDWCIRYVMDFLLMRKAAAWQFCHEHLDPYIISKGWCGSESKGLFENG